MVKNVNRTARLQWKVDTIKNCIYLQCFLDRAFYVTKKSIVLPCSGNLFLGLYPDFSFQLKLCTQTLWSGNGMHRYEIFHPNSFLRYMQNNVENITPGRACNMHQNSFVQI